MVGGIGDCILENWLIGKIKRKGGLGRWDVSWLEGAGGDSTVFSGLRVFVMCAWHGSEIENDYSKYELM